MRNRERGVTFIGWLFLLIPLAIVGYAGIRLTPVYLNYMKVVRALEQLADNSKGEENLSAQSLRNSLEKLFDTGYLDYPAVKDISFRREGKVWIAEAKYEDMAPLFGDVSLLARFDKKVEIQ